MPTHRERPDDVWLYGYAAPYGRRTRTRVTRVRDNGTRQRIYERLVPGAFTELLGDVATMADQARSRGRRLPRYLDTELVAGHGHEQARTAAFFAGNPAVKSLRGGPVMGVSAGADLAGGRLRLDDDGYGLFFAARLVDDIRTRELLRAIRAGRMRHASIWYSPAESRDRTIDGHLHEEVVKVGRLRHLSLVDDAAYPGTCVHVAGPVAAGRLARGLRPDGDHAAAAGVGGGR